MPLNSNDFVDNTDKAVTEFAAAIFAVTAALTEAAKLFFHYEFPEGLETEFVKKLRKTNEVVFAAVPNQWKLQVAEKVKQLAETPTESKAASDGI